MTCRTGASQSLYVQPEPRVFPRDNGCTSDNIPSVRAHRKAPAPEMPKMRGLTYGHRRKARDRHYSTLTELGTPIHQERTLRMAGVAILRAGWQLKRAR